MIEDDDGYHERLARDIRLKYGDPDGNDFYKAAVEFQTEVKRAVKERSTFTVLPTPQAVVLLMVLHQCVDAMKFYRGEHEAKR